MWLRKRENIMHNFFSLLFFFLLNGCFVFLIIFHSLSMFKNQERRTQHEIRPNQMISVPNEQQSDAQMRPTHINCSVHYWRVLNIAILRQWAGVLQVKAIPKCLLLSTCYVFFNFFSVLFWFSFLFILFYFLFCNFLTYKIKLQSKIHRNTNKSDEQMDSENRRY